MQITEDVQLRQASRADCNEVAALLRRCGLPADDIHDIIDAFQIALEKGR
ncbi:GNAT family N-acetyltransferase, partial [Salmonella sp. gx-f9]|nr:GNAT family N-acetyltransferase [Salmonella sp. gx-f9]